MIFYISCETDDLMHQCQSLMQEYQLDYSTSQYPRLHLTDLGLVLLDKQAKSIELDWNDSKWKQRAKGGRGQDPLVKVSLAGLGASILDITAGWGRDALVMANAGGRLTLLEKNPYMALMLKQAYQKLEDVELKKHIKIHHMDAHLYLQQLSQKDYPDVVFIDPMHPQRQKKALVKKHLQVLQQFLLPNEDVKEMIELAYQKCLKRVVVKWPEKEKSMLPADFSVSGKTIRFDVYQKNK
jgi:16S rRNA (guanine1516-N2)-methyltransferase